MDGPDSPVNTHEEPRNDPNDARIGISAADVFSALAIASAMSALYFVVGFLLYLLAEAINQSIVSHRTWKWFGDGIDEYIGAGMVIGLLAFVIVCIDLFMRLVHGTELLQDVAHFPRFWRASDWFRSRSSRTVIVVGSLALAAYYTMFVLEVFRQGHGGTVVAPNLLLNVFLLAWGMLWFADCLTRKARGTLPAAISFLLAILVLTAAIPDQIYRE